MKGSYRTILVVAPHPDDEVLGCGGTIIKAIKNGMRVFVLYLTSGERKQNIREKEAVKVCKYLKTGNPYFLRLYKEELKVTLGNVGKIMEKFSQLKPDIVLVNHDQDADREHKISYELTIEAVWRYNFKAEESKKIRGVLLYEIHKPMQTYNMVEDISKVIRQKMKAMSLYKSQLNNSKIDLAMQGLNRYRGSMQENIDYAEVFQIKKLASLFS